ncbi:T9SS type A sorting domain-containing protein, partial [bacterium]|nr:T9SS type A sorting domain-containing protein [bacterium]
SGEFRRLLVAIFVPKLQGNDNHPGTYKGRLDCWGNIVDAATDSEVAHDFFDIEIHLSREVGHGDEENESEFGGYPDGGGARLYWGSFHQLGLAGPLNLYRAEAAGGSYVRINITPLSPNSDLLDTEIEAGVEYNYRLGIGSQGSEIFIGPVTVGGAPKFYLLRQNVPNPFRDGTDISYQLPSLTHVSLRVYDVRGRLVRILREGEEPAGFYTAAWDRKDERGRDVASGVYFYRYVTPLFEETRKMVVLH